MWRSKPRVEVDSGLDAGAVVAGFLIGAALGALWGLFNAPRSGVATRGQITRGISETGDSVRERIDGVVGADPVSESIAEGKAAARRRREQLGLAGPEYPAVPPARTS